MAEPDSTRPRSDQDLSMASRPWPSFAEALSVWTRIALLSFGGPAGQIAMMHRILVEEKRWLGDGRFLHALNFCMLLPGPEAQQLAVYIGWLMHRTAGGFAAGILFILPGAISILALSIVYALYGGVGVVAGLFFGLKAAVLAIVLQAVIRIGRRALRNRTLTAIAITSFIAIFAFDLPFPMIIGAAALFGFVGARAGLGAFQTAGSHGGGPGTPVADVETILGEDVPSHARPGAAKLRTVVALLLALWLSPTIAIAALLGPDDVFTNIAVFFSQMAVVTFGGAYAVLAYVAQAAVDTYGWLSPGEMLDGLGLAETTPGPLIMVTQFVGFLGAYRDPGQLHPLLAGVLGGLLTTWVTFVPCFLWIFLGAPHIERLRGNRALTAALGAITAAVVGVILNLAVWFAVHVVFREVVSVGAPVFSLSLPVLTSVDPAAAVLSVAALVALFRFRVGVIVLLGAMALAGLGLHLAGWTSGG